MRRDEYGDMLENERRREEMMLCSESGHVIPVGGFAGP